ncbi:hypothetical protein OG413_41205 [Streptomyces sp. NBC_01433]|uniref:hypothetical protein n=1 Tax=Streptomyces sp. NBC_01433 TaxID=2903864 RepID=UPI00225A82E4|nr:hypothetical protein [Streptomyces sp. NBC_01433]MCX4681622.1 hypothetical protein [Streptomyces sp. NBC_01433]
MQNSVNEALADIRVEPAGHLLGRPERGLTHVSWTHALAQLEATGRSVVPRSTPTELAREVLTYRLQSTFGFLLDAAARFLDSGDQEDAERTAHEARTIKALTVAPALRHHRAETRHADGTRKELLDHRVTAEGNGFLALSVAELTAAIGPGRKARGQLPAVPPPDPAAFVVLWNRISAPGLILTGMNAILTGGELGAALLQSHLATAARALIPGENHQERR